uniref:Uncharacterized protein n=1 Tax=Panagrolaimus davidi TaxID=227884 RepID=A0A914QAZ2_9BILA
MDKDDIYAPFLPQVDTLPPDLEQDEDFLQVFLQDYVLGYDQPISPQIQFQQQPASPPLHPPIIADLFCSWNFWELMPNCKQIVDLPFYSYPSLFPLQSPLQLPLVQHNYQAQPSITVPPVQFALQSYGLPPQHQLSANVQSTHSSVRPPSTGHTILPAVPGPFGPLITVPPVQFALQTYGLHQRQQLCAYVQSPHSSVRPPSPGHTYLRAVPGPFGSFVTVPPVQFALQTYGLPPQQQLSANVQLPHSSIRPPSTGHTNLPAVQAIPGPANRQMIPLRTGRNTYSFKTLPFEKIKKQKNVFKLSNKISWNFFLQSERYTSTLKNQVDEIDPVLGRIYKEECFIKSQVIGYYTQHLKPCESQSFDYIFLCKEILGSGDLNVIPFLTFLKSAVYIGKGKGYRELGHLKSLLENGGSNAGKLIAISEMLDGEGVIIHRNNNFNCEHISHYYEGSAIDLLFEQISNDKRGFFPGKDSLNIDLSMIKKFGFQTLLRAYLSFIEHNHFVVTRENYEKLFKNKSHQIGAKVDQDKAFSRWNLVTAGKKALS